MYVAQDVKLGLRPPSSAKPPEFLMKAATTDLRELLAQQGLPTEGSRVTLLERLTEFLLTADDDSAPQAACQPVPAVPQPAQPVAKTNKLQLPGAELEPLVVGGPHFDDPDDADEALPPSPGGAGLPPRPKTSRGGPGCDPFHYVMPSPPRSAPASLSQQRAEQSGTAKASPAQQHSQRVRQAFAAFADVDMGL